MCISGNIEEDNMYPDTVSEPSVVAPIRKIRNGMIWYAAVLPALGLFLENYALNKYLGMLIWCIVILARPAACLADRHILLSSGAVKSSPLLLAFFPTVYIFKRCFDLKQNTAVAVVCIISLSYGIIGNGFVVGMSVNDDSIIEYVKGKYAHSVAGTQLEGQPVSFEDAVSKTLDNVKYEITQKGDERTVAVKGKTKEGSDEICFIFTVVHDGFTLTEFKLSEVIKNGTKLEGDERSELLRKLLTPQVRTNESTAESK